MFSNASRPLTEAERKQIQERARGVNRRLVREPVLSALLAIFLFAFGIPAMAADPSLNPAARWLVIAAFAFFFIMVSRALPTAWRNAREERRRLYAALEENRAEVTHYEAYDAIILVDEEPGWIFDIGQGRLLCLRGLDTYPDNIKDPDRWPNTHFETRWVPGAGIWLCTEVSGNRLSSAPLVDLSQLNPTMRDQLETPPAGSDATKQIFPGRLEDLYPS